MQGVGFRPTVARLARALNLPGTVYNDGHGVLVLLACSGDEKDAFLSALHESLPPLARIESLEVTAHVFETPPSGFHIGHSVVTGAIETILPPDTATCAACLHDVRDPKSRRFLYPFTTCTDCGPRFSIATRLPFDRSATTMTAFALCSACAHEYENPEDRRYHAQTMACASCGPVLEVAASNGQTFDQPWTTSLRADGPSGLAPAIEALRNGGIVAVKGLGGYHLCCDATNEDAVARLRRGKRRSGKAFALMARDLTLVRDYAHVCDDEAQALTSDVAPIVLLTSRFRGPTGLREANTLALAPSVSPGLRTLGFMLPYTPLHHLLLEALDRPLVCTSGNLSDAPQCIDDDEAERCLAPIVDGVVRHDRRIVHRVDDSVVAVYAGRVRVLRRARGMAPAPMPLPPGFRDVPALWAAGGHLKSTLTFVQGARAWVSPHLGDLDSDATLTAYELCFQAMSQLLGQVPAHVAVDAHPDYASTRKGEAWAVEESAEVHRIYHHHAHVAAVLAEHGVPLEEKPCFGVALDGVGLGPEEALWGCEVFTCDYRQATQRGGLMPVRLVGGDRAARTPWRSLDAFLRADPAHPTLLTFLRALPRSAELARLCDQHAPALARILAGPLRPAPLSSCGRLFDAVAALVGLCPGGMSYEGQAAMELEALIDEDHLQHAQQLPPYVFTVTAAHGDDTTGPLRLAPGFWAQALEDLACGRAPGLVAARFHLGLAEGLTQLTAAVRAREAEAGRPYRPTVALGGGCLGNRILAEALDAKLRAEGFEVLLPALLPAHDGALSFGQAVVASARILSRR